MASVARQKERACAVKMAASAQARGKAAGGNCFPDARRRDNARVTWRALQQGDDPVIQWIVYLSRINRTLGEV